MPSSGDTFPFGQTIVWQPNLDWQAASNLAAFMQRHALPDYASLLARANADIGWFWETAIADLGIRFATPYTQVVDLSAGIEFPTWCVGGRMNIVETCLDKWLETPLRDKPALVWEGEEGATRTFTFADLKVEVNCCANALRSLGLGKGDAVGLFMPMVPELAIASLAVIQIGGIILPLFSGYGHSALVTRLADAGAKAVFTADGMVRRGRTVAMKPVLDGALPDVPSVEHVIVVRRAGIEGLAWQEGRDSWWHDLVAVQPANGETEIMDAEDVLMVIYTSGTTGKPKGAVHTHCGFPIKAAQDLRHSFDLKPGDVLCWMTDMGWMMGPWEVFGALINGATLVFYDGAPDFPDVDRLWALVERHSITHLGVSPTLVRSLQTHGTAPVARHDLSSLRLAGSTGSPWDPDSWRWLFTTVLGGAKPIINYSGGTEVSGGILCGNLFTPLKPCAFSGPVVGMDAEVVDEDGAPVRGRVGELVVRQPWIGMTRGFWNDNERYLDAYWRRLPGQWVHGDFAAIDEDGLWYILGRSDDTIKVAGKRLGPSEVETILCAHPAVQDAAAIGVPHPIKDQEVVAFCLLHGGRIGDETLRAELMERVVEELGKPLKPRAILFVRDLPRTRNAKVMRRVVRAAWLDEPLGDLSSLEDLSAVDAVREAW